MARVCIVPCLREPLPYITAAPYCLDALFSSRSRMGSVARLPATPFLPPCSACRATVSWTPENNATNITNIFGPCLLYPNANICLFLSTIVKELSILQQSLCYFYFLLLLLPLVYQCHFSVIIRKSKGLHSACFEFVTFSI